MHEFFGDDIPPYAILSHRWTDDEIDFKDYNKGRRKDSIGYTKITSFCHVVKSAGHQWAWIDTCCIDKRSSAELSEAINSMFSWYEKARVCCVYLADVECLTEEILSVHYRLCGTPEHASESALDSRLARQFRESEWFTRGWTLQELLAPPVVRFYARDWQFLHSLGEDFRNNTLTELISEATGISQDVLQSRAGSWGLRSYSVAQKISWLASRKTTRVEDRAYCALGLFGIKMPLLYGEGEAAWTRLQEEIVRTTHEESIFQWSLGEEHSLTQSVPLLAPSARYFATCSALRRNYAVNRLPYTLTNQGLEMPLLPNTAMQAVFNQRKIFLLPLNCTSNNAPGIDPTDPANCCCIVLVQLACGHFERAYPTYPLILDVPFYKVENPDFKILKAAPTIHVHTTAAVSDQCKQFNDWYDYDVTKQSCQRALRSLSSYVSGTVGEQMDGVLQEYERLHEREEPGPVSVDTD